MNKYLNTKLRGILTLFFKSEKIIEKKYISKPFSTTNLETHFVVWLKRNLKYRKKLLTYKNVSSFISCINNIENIF